MHNLISLKKYLDLIPAKAEADDPALKSAKKKPASAPSNEKDPELDQMAKVILDCYRSALLSMGENGVKACPSVGLALQQSLTSLEDRFRS